MDYLIPAAKFVLLTLSLLYGLRYLVCIIWKKTISEAHAWCMAMSIAGFATLQWL